jgi:hypothetical protein
MVVTKLANNLFTRESDCKTPTLALNQHKKDIKNKRKPRQGAETVIKDVVEAASDVEPRDSLDQGERAEGSAFFAIQKPSILLDDDYGLTHLVAGKRMMLKAFSINRV